MARLLPLLKSQMVHLAPRENKFYEMFGEMSDNLIQGARLLVEILRDFRDVPVRVQKLKDIEDLGDIMTHNIITKLNQTFITPFDREDIHKLASSIDDVLDYLNSAGDRLVLYKIQSVPSDAEKLAELVTLQCEELHKAVKNLNKHDYVLEHCMEINRLEDEADSVSRRAIGRLFDQEPDPITLIKLTELFEVLETASDKAEDAANVLESVVLKSA